MRIKIALSYLAFVLAGLTVFGQTIIPGGYVSGTWDSTGSPYLIEAPVTIHRDSALYIEAGCMLQFHDSAYLSIEGYIRAMGTPMDSVIFTAAQSSWLGIRIQQTDTAYQGNLLFHYCAFSRANGGAVFADGGAFSVKDRDDVTIFNSTFSQNYASGRGGAIYLQNADIQLKRLYFGDNSTSLVLQAGKGGAIYALDSDYILEEITFSGNRSSIAGAFYSDNTNLDLRDCSFVGNSSHAGGGALVCHRSGELLVDRCVFASNTASGSGGAIALLEAIDAYFRDCEILDNTSETELFLSDGGGILVTPYDNELDLINCNVSGNRAGDFGGGVYTASDATMIGCLFSKNHAELDNSHGGGGGAILQAQSNGFSLNCTFSGNTAPGTGSIYCADGYFTLVNSILWDDTISADPKIYLGESEDPTGIHVSYSDIEGGAGVIRGYGDYEIDWGDGNIASDPLFETFGSDYALSNESPCIDTGRLDIYAVMLPLIDLAGNSRVFREKVDMGCYENQFPFWIEERPLPGDFLVYPNPAGDYFFIRNEMGKAFSGQYTITDISGKRIRSEDIYLAPGERISGRCSGLPEGMYLLRLGSVDHHSVYKLLVQ
ncbi:MAG: right-handed parallel beta-helix repeat-containing protein [Bacteroidales bacterium]|jgi:predicted outer membrane repeat protein|nr:right-handed parallel beta-helix repeat-containing protein [Bacteroidales bacterium]